MALGLMQDMAVGVHALAPTCGGAPNGSPTA